MDSSLIAVELASVKKWLIVNLVVSVSVLVVLLLLLIAVKATATTLISEGKAQIEKFEKKAEQIQSQVR